MVTQPIAPPVQHQMVRHLHYMYGAVTQLELNGFLDTSSIDDEARKQQIKADWRTAAQVFQEVRAHEAGDPDTVVTRPLSTDDAARVERLRADPIFVNTFPNYPITVEEVEIDKLVACQRTVHSEYVDQVRVRFESSNRDLMDFCVVPGQDATPVIVGRTAQNAFTASSENPGLRFLGAFEQAYTPDLLTQVPSGQPVSAVVLVLGYGSSTVNAFRVGRRLILNNGFHRLYTLRVLGVTRAPVVIQQITTPEVELPPMLNELPRDYLVENPRPAMLKDFFNDHLTCIVTLRSFIKSMQVGWGVNEGLVPR